MARNYNIPYVKEWMENILDSYEMLAAELKAVEAIMYEQDEQISKLELQLDSCSRIIEGLGHQANIEIERKPDRLEELIYSGRQRHE